ncbi:MAG: hypothetical protein WD431_11880 [Cyclobacteriaceae bacterium]
MNTLELPEKSTHLEIPSHWDEMNQAQRLYCLSQAVKASAGVIRSEEALVRCFYHLAEIQRDYKSVAMERIMSEEQRMEKQSRTWLLAETLCGFVFRENEKKELEICYETVYNHFPVIRAGKVKLYGPGHLLADLTFGEFRAALEEMNEYFETRESECMDRFLACLYRPERSGYAELSKREDFDGFRREPFNRSRISVNAEHTKNIGQVIRTSVLIWFSYLIGYIQKETLILGGVEVNFSSLFSGGSGEGRRSRGNGWVSVLHNVAKEGPFGDVGKTDKMGLFDVLLYMKDCDDQNREMKRKLKKK